MGKRVGTGVGFALALLLVVPSSSHAAVSCTFNPLGNMLLVDLGANGDEVEITRDGDELLVESAGGADVACANGPADVFTTDTVSISQTGPKDSEVIINYLNDANPFEPGASTAGGDAGVMATREIEFVATLRGGRDVLNLRNPVRVVAGATGINPNATLDEVDPDADITAFNVERIAADGAGGEDLLDFSGGACCGGAVAIRSFLNGGIDDDIVIGGSGDDQLIGDDGEDELSGGRGDDLIDGGHDADLMLGARGIDLVTYESSGDPVVASIGSGTGDDGGADDGPSGSRDTVALTVEGLIGSDDDDELTGNAADNFLEGGLGVDSLFGLGGNDRIDARDGVQDTEINCGAGNGDSARIDGPPPPTDPAPVSC